MIQRIQSLYLLMIILLAICSIVMPVAELINTTQNILYTMDFRGVTLVQPNGQRVIITTTWLLTSLLLVTSIIAGISLFSYKKRQKQIRLSVINFIFLGAYYVVLTIFIWSACRELNAEWHLHSTVVLPAVAIILNFMSMKAIEKDEKLVKSMDRIR